MNNRCSSAIAALVFTVSGATAFAQRQECPINTARAHGQVLDSTGAAIVGATLTQHGAPATRTEPDGHFTTACIAAGPHTVTVAAKGFAPASFAISNAEGHVNLVRLKVLGVETEVTVTDDNGTGSTDVAGSKTLNTTDIRALADDPDEFARQLQVLAAAAGGAPGQAIVTVDGFQNGGRIPPKSSIAYIRINPDLFSAEYQRPPYTGGRIEIYTKPGQSRLHGALFTTQSAAFVNAKDPFATSRAAIGKQRYGFELSGPIQANRSDFAVSLEHRQINQFAVVNAVILDANGNAAQSIHNVATPQSLWQGNLRFGAMLTKKNNFTFTYTAGVNGLTNVGVGGPVLIDAGYNSVQSEHTVRGSNLQTLSANMVHETRLGYTWRYRTDTPNSIAPSLQVAGSFTGGGAVTGYLRTHERDLEFDDDLLMTRGKHNLKVGIELENTSLHESIPANFNGAYIFGGGTAPNLTGGGTTVISGLEQYRRAVNNLAGGTPTQYNVTTGSPQVALNQLQVVLYGQDLWQVKPRLAFSYGVRWAMQNNPTTISNAGPRVGVAWSPDKKQKTTFHLRSGLFYGTVDPQTVITAQRLNGSIQSQQLVYNPAYNPGSTQPVTGTATITTLRASLPSLSQTPSLQSHFGVEHEFPRHWHAQGNFYLIRAWDILRTRNINSPFNGAPTGTRPLLPNLNLLQYQQTGHLRGDVLFMGVDQHSMKHLQIFAGYIRMDFRGNADNDNFAPQSTYTDAGETARPSWQATHHVITFASTTLPKNVALSMQFDAASGSAYNVTTGFDNNGDGNFNDRPFYNPSATSPTYNTRFGTLAPAGTGATIGRNVGTMPWNVHLDANLSRSFSLPHAAGKEAQTLAVNLRSTNLLNHTNITTVDGVLGSPLYFGQGVAADAGRRVEAGLRWNF